MLFKDPPLPPEDPAPVPPDKEPPDIPGKPVIDPPEEPRKLPLNTVSQCVSNSWSV